MLCLPRAPLFLSGLLFGHQHPSQCFPLFILIISRTLVRASFTNSTAWASSGHLTLINYLSHLTSFKLFPSLSHLGSGLMQTLSRTCQHTGFFSVSPKYSASSHLPQIGSGSSCWMSLWHLLHGANHHRLPVLTVPAAAMMTKRLHVHGCHLFYSLQQISSFMEAGLCLTQPHTSRDKAVMTMAYANTGHTSHALEASQEFLIPGTSCWDSCSGFELFFKHLPHLTSSHNLGLFSLEERQKPGGSSFFFVALSVLGIVIQAYFITSH